MTNSLAAFLYVRGLFAEDLSQVEIQAQTDCVRACLLKLQQDLLNTSDEADEQTIQAVFYEAGKLHFSTKLRWWFQVLYQALLSENEGPRLGQFTKMMTIHWVSDKIDQVITDYWAMNQVHA